MHASFMYPASVLGLRMYEILCVPCCLFFNHSIVSNSLWTYRLQHPNLPYPSPPPGACSNSCPLSWRCHPNILSSVIPFSSCLQSFPAPVSFLMSQLFTSGGQSIGASTSVLPINTQSLFPLGLIGFISLPSKGCSRVFSKVSQKKERKGMRKYLRR